jgi:hypothetical protein
MTPLSILNPKNWQQLYLNYNPVLTIKLFEFIGYSKDDLYQYLNIQNENSFKIIIAKQTVESGNDDYDIFHEYHVLTWVGQNLYLLADEFSYYVPSVKQKRSFVFYVTVNDMIQFSNQLQYLITGLFDINSTGDIDFYMDAANFYISVFEEEEIEVDVGCWGSLEIERLYLNKYMSY